MAREFQTGAYRDGEEGKNDYEGFLSPLVIKGFGNYMTKHRKQSNGEWRDSDNWQKGITKDSYMKSMWRHFLDVWLEYDGYKSRDGLDEALYGLLFNVMGFIHETEKENLNTCENIIAIEYAPSPDCKRECSLCWHCGKCGRKFEGLEMVRGSDIEEND